LGKTSDEFYNATWEADEEESRRVCVKMEEPTRGYSNKTANETWIERYQQGQGEIRLTIRGKGGVGKVNQGKTD